MSRSRLESCGPLAVAADEPVRGRGRRRGERRGGRLARAAPVERQQLLVQRRQARPGRGAELLPQQHARVLEGAQRLGGVALRAQRLHQRQARRLAERRRLHRRPRRALGQGEVAAAQAHRRRGLHLERLQPQLAELRPLVVDPRRLEAGQQALLGDRPRPPGGVARVGRRARGERRPRRGQVRRRRLPVHPRVRGQHERQLGAALDPARAPAPSAGATAAAPAARRRPAPIASASSSRRTGAVAVQDEEGEQQPALATAQPLLDSRPLDQRLQPAAELDAGPPAFHVRVNLTEGLGFRKRG